MHKPDYPITADERFDYGLSERVARHLESSALHVYSACVVSAVPAPLGDPNDPHTSILVDFTMLTDGRRGWLILVSAQDEYDAEHEMTELVASLVAVAPEPCTFVVRAVRTHGRAPRGDLDLTDSCATRETLEAEFARRFDDAPRGPVAAFLVPFITHHYALRDELRIRRDMHQDTH